ncbi:MAG TPA: hypothetical protein VLX12_01950 [Syntrophorhabdales bacterium]|nr:hypothetical protein [Syntrophorhabdales bacterium]
MARGRQFLKGVVAAGVGLGLSHLSSRCSLAQEQAKAKTNGDAYKFDVHHHILPPEYVRILTERGILFLGTRFAPWSVEKTLGMMDKNGKQTAIVSVSSPAANIGDDMPLIVPKEGHGLWRVMERGMGATRILKVLFDQVLVFNRHYHSYSPLEKRIMPKCVEFGDDGLLSCPIQA